MTKRKQKNNSKLIVKQEGKLVFNESLQGEVIEVSNTDIIIRFDTVDDIIEQTYEINQFKKIPAIGDQVIVRVLMTLLEKSPVNITKIDKPQRTNIITGGNRF